MSAVVEQAAARTSNVSTELMLAAERGTYLHKRKLAIIILLALFAATLCCSTFALSVLRIIASRVTAAQRSRSPGHLSNGASRLQAHKTSDQVSC